MSHIIYAKKNLIQYMIISLIKIWLVWTRRKVHKALCKKDSPYRGKKSRGKVTKFFASDQSFPRQIFPGLYFSRPVFFLDFFSPDKEFIPILFSIIIMIIIISDLFAKFIIIMFFYVLDLSWLINAVLTKISKCKWKQGI